MAQERSDMDRIYARASVSISDLKKNPSRIINEAEGSPVAILNHNKPSAYLVPAETFEALMERFEDYELGRLVRERENEATVKVSLDELVPNEETIEAMKAARRGELVTAGSAGNLLERLNAGD